MDMSCNYINQQGYCESPKLGGDKEECCASNYHNCLYFPQCRGKYMLFEFELNSLEKLIRKNDK